MAGQEAVIDATNFFGTLAERLRLLQPRGRIAFAAACAERIADAPPSAVPQIARELLRGVWEELLGQRTISNEVLHSGIAKCEEAVAEEHALVNLAAVASDDALAAIIFALRTRQNGSAEDAAWAGRRVWDSIDWYLANHVLVEGSEQELRAHPTVQAEAARQARDIEKLSRATDAEVASVVEQLRESARRDAGRLFGEGAV